MVLVDLEIGSRMFWFVAAATATCTATRVPRPSDVALVGPSQLRSLEHLLFKSVRLTSRSDQYLFKTENYTYRYVKQVM